MKIMTEIETRIMRKYAARQARQEHPEGSFDNGGRWYPSPVEHCNCCDAVRSPSGSWPYSLMLHCRTRKHITNLLATA